MPTHTPNPFGDLPALTPDDIDHLRKRRVVDPEGGSHGRNSWTYPSDDPSRLAFRTAPYILWRPVTPGSPHGRLTLYDNGRPVCWSPHPGLLASLLAGEAVEPGYIARVMSTADHAEMAALDPHSAAVARQKANAEIAKARLASEAAAEATRRRNSIIAPDVAGMSLDDLLG